MFAFFVYDRNLNIALVGLDMIKENFQETTVERAATILYSEYMSS